jgi:hypothetical protein
MTARYKINTSIIEAEKCGLMAYIGARKSNNELWGLISGNLLAGPWPSYLTLIFRNIWQTRQIGEEDQARGV